VVLSTEAVASPLLDEPVDSTGVSDDDVVEVTGVAREVDEMVSCVDDSARRDTQPLANAAAELQPNMPVHRVHVTLIYKNGSYQQHAQNRIRYLQNNCLWYRSVITRKLVWIELDCDELFTLYKRLNNSYENKPNTTTTTTTK
jgi:hypothetical protein